MNKYWEAERQTREGGDCAIAMYAPNNGRGQPIRTGRYRIPEIRLINVFVDNVLHASFVSLSGGRDGANALLDELLGKLILTVDRSAA